MLIQAIYDSIMSQKNSEKSTFTDKKFSSLLQKGLPKENLGKLIFVGGKVRNREVEIKMNEEELLLFFYIGGEIINKDAPEKIKVQEFDKDTDFDIFLQKVQEKMEHAVCQAIFSGILSEEAFYEAPPEEILTKSDIEKLRKKLKIKESLESQKTFAQLFTIKRLNSTIDAMLSSDKTYTYNKEWGEICIEGNSLSPKKITLFADSKKQCFKLLFSYGKFSFLRSKAETLLDVKDIRRLKETEEDKRMKLLFSMAREKLEDEILLSICDESTQPDEILGEWHKFNYEEKKSENKKLLKETQELTSEILADFSPKNFSDKTDVNMEKLFETILKLSENVEWDARRIMSWRKYC